MGQPPSTTDISPRRPNGRSARVRRQVVDAVRAQLVDGGFDLLTMEAVADRSGVHRTTVYRRWRDVGGLLADVLADVTGDDWSPPQTGSLETDLAAVNREIHAALTADPPITTALIAASFRSPQAAEALQTFWADRYARCAAIVRRAIDRGEVPADTDPRAVIIAATAPLYHTLVLLRASADTDLAAHSAHQVSVAARAGAFARPSSELLTTGMRGSGVR